MIVTWRSLNNSVHFNLLHFKLLSRERETEHDAANACRSEPWAYICLSGQ